MNWSFSQTSISNVINSYAAVDSIYPTKDTIEVSNPSAFSVNDTVMIYQAKGAVVETDTAPVIVHLFGYVRNLGDAKNAGKYEIILVREIKGDTIVLKANLSNAYDTEDLVQLIRVPSFKNVSVDGVLTCGSWDGQKGGVLALMVSDTLFLNADIDAKGKGFRGSTPFESSGDCAEIDAVLYKSQYFSESATTVSAGFKGEGISKFDTTYRKGLGCWANGGGGGNAKFSGGGGGGNSGKGGFGGEEDTLLCSNPNYGGYWNSHGGSYGYGLGDLGFFSDNTIFFGGGGGAGTYKSGLTASTGGNGGGIVIIIAKVIKSSGDYNITADGESVTDIVDASGGGGGAGGTVAFDVDSVIGDLNLSLKGGDGGWVKTFGASGPGGGGGGGAILFNRSIINNDFTADIAGGDVGSSEDRGYSFPHKASSGDNGKTIISDVKMPLTGFLFNSITSNQEVCMNGIPEILSGSEPRGGDGTYTFQWLYSSDSTIWSPIIPAATQRDYQPPALTDTIYYRRIVTSSGGTITDFGNDIQIIVHDYIVNNDIFMPSDSIICIGNAVDTITGTEVKLGDGGDNISYEYFWEYSFNSSEWTTETDTKDTIYEHGEVMDTTFVRRIVISGACEDTATLYNPIIGLPQISNNVLSPDQEICEGQIPVEIIGGIPQDGDGTYTIFWEESTDASNWNIVSDSTRNDLAPSNIIETTYYRRTVESDDCIDISDNHKVNVLVPISNDFIETNSLISTCYNIPPQLILGSTPADGDEPNYNYQWQESTDAASWSNISSNANNKDYQALALTAKTYYRRLVSSGENDCCTSVTDTIQVEINPLPIVSIANIVDTVCSGEDLTLNFSLSSGQLPFVINYNDGFNDFTSAPVNIYNPIVNPVSSDESTEYNYTLVSVVDNNACEATEINGLTQITVYGNPNSNAGIDDERCSLTYKLSAESTLGTGLWSQVSGEGITEFNNETSDTSTITVDLAGVYTYKWEETNWECKDSANVEITLYERPFNIRVSPQDTTLFFVDEYELKGAYQNPDNFEVISTWEFIVGRGEIEQSANDLIVNIKDLNDLGEDKILIDWTVKKGNGNNACPDSVVNASIKLKEMFTPTGFTPNGDGINDYLKFNGIENSDENDLIIYNRWGTKVKSIVNYSNDFGWDGKDEDGDDLPEDTYYYILNVKDDGVSQTHKGFIVIKRY